MAAYFIVASNLVVPIRQLELGEKYLNQATEEYLTTVTMKELLEAGVHFGHQVKRWNPKMKSISSVKETEFTLSICKRPPVCLKTRSGSSPCRAAEGKTIMFVGTKRQAQEAIARSDEMQPVLCESTLVGWIAD